MGEWPEFHLSALLRRLVNGGVDFVVVGGVAAVAHGSPRITFDLDIVFATDEPNLQRLRDVLADLNPRLRGVTEDVPFAPDTRTLRHTRLLNLDTDEGRLDLVCHVKGYERLMAAAIEAVVHGTAIRVAGLDDLIAMKKDSGRPWDRVHVEELQAIKRLSGG